MRTLLRRRLLLNDVRCPRLTHVAVLRLLLNAARHAYLALAMHRLLLKALRLLHLCCPGLHVLAAAFTFAHLKHIAGLRYAPLCSGPFAVKSSPGTSAHFALLLCDLLCLPAVGNCSFHFLHGFLGPDAWLFLHGFLGPNPWLFSFLFVISRCRCNFGSTE